MRRLGLAAALALLGATGAHAASWHVAMVPVPAVIGSYFIDTSAVSGNGRVVAFTYGNCGDGGLRLALYDRVKRTTALVGSRGDGTTKDRHGNCTTDSPSLSEDGRRVAFVTSSDFAAPQVNDPSTTPLGVFVADTVTGAAREVRLRVPALTAKAAVDAVAISGDGKRLAVRSRNQELVTGRVVDGSCFGYLVDLARRAIGPASVGADRATRTVSCAAPLSIDRTGRHVAFVSAERLTTADTDGTDNVYVRDVARGTTVLAAKHQSTGTVVDDANPVLSADGSTVAFLTVEHTPPPPYPPVPPQSGIAGLVNALLDLVYAETRDGAAAQAVLRVADLRTGTVRNAPTAVTPALSAAHQYEFDLSGDGRYVALAYNGTTQQADASGDGAQLPAVYRWTVATGTVETVVETTDTNRAAGEAVARQSTNGLFLREVRTPRISDDGTVVTFVTSEPVAENDKDYTDNVYAASLS